MHSNSSSSWMKVHLTGSRSQASRLLKQMQMEQQQKQSQQQRVMRQLLMRMALLMALLRVCGSSVDTKQLVWMVLLVMAATTTPTPPWTLLSQAACPSSHYRWVRSATKRLGCDREGNKQSDC
jgi:hypothetical protein